MLQSLTDSQRNYSWLEKEALALVMAVKRFHKFFWGIKFILQTDHKPLKRWAIRLLGRDFSIEYIRTQEFGQADALSRLIDKFRKDNLEELQVASVQSVENEIKQIRDFSIDKFGKNLQLQLTTAIRSDFDLKVVIDAIRNKKFPFLCSPAVDITKNATTVCLLFKILYFLETEWLFHKTCNLLFFPPYIRVIQG